MSESPKKIHDDFRKDENVSTSATVNPVDSDIKDSEVRKPNTPSCSESEATSFVVHQPTKSCIESSEEISQASKDECLQVVREEKKDSIPKSPENPVTGSDSNLPQTFPLSTPEIVDEFGIPVAISSKEQPLIGFEPELKHSPFESKILSDSDTQKKQASPDSEPSLSSQASANVFNVTDKETSSSSDVKDEQVSPSTSNISETFNEDSSVSSPIQSEEISLELEIQSSLPSSPPQTTDEECLVASSIDSECTTELADVTDEKGSSSTAISLEKQAEPELKHSISASSDYFSSSSAVQEKQISLDTVLPTISQTDDPVKTSHEEISLYSDVKEKHQTSSPPSNSEIESVGSTIPSSIQSKDESSRLDIYPSHRSTVLPQGVFSSVVSPIHSKQRETEFKEITPPLSTISPLETVSKSSDNLPVSSEQSEIKLDETLPNPSSSENNGQYDSSPPTMPAEQLLTEDEKVPQTIPSNPSEIQNESSIPSVTLAKQLPPEPDSEISTAVPDLTLGIFGNERASSVTEVLKGPPPLSTTFVLIKNSEDSISNETEAVAKKMLKQVTRMKFMLKELKEMESLLNRGFRSSNIARRAAIIASSPSDKKCTAFTKMHLCAQEVRFDAAQLFAQIQMLYNWFRLNEDIDERIKVYESDIENFYQIAGDMLTRFNHGIYQ